MKKFYLLMLLALVASWISGCHERTNVFDILDEDFKTPPHIWLAYASGAYYDTLGYLIGVHIDINFTDDFEKTLPLYHEFYQDVSLRLEIDYDAPVGTNSYYVEIFGPYEVGEYCLKIYFGNIPIGACLFQVVSEGDRLKIKDTFTCTMEIPQPVDWSYTIAE